MKYTQVRADAFQTLQMNAGIMVDSFNPATGEIGNILGATTGGFAFASNPTYNDFGEDVDNVPPNTWQLKHLQYFDPQVSGTFLTVTAVRAKGLIGAADVSSEDATRVIPRNILKEEDFEDVWVIGDYSDVNEDSTEGNAGFIAIHLMNALNTGGFQIKTADKAKGQFAFEFTGHYSMSAQDTVPYELYVRVGGGEATPGVTLNKSTASIAVEGTETLTATTVPAGQTVTWSSSDDEVATVSGGVVTGVAAGTATITASITVDGQTYTATCAVTVTE